MSSKMALQNRLQSYILIGTTGVRDHSNGLRELADQLKACGEHMSEANLCMRLLLSMPTDYADVVNLFKWTDSASLQYSTILQSLIAKETEIKAKRAEGERTAEAVRAHVASLGVANPAALIVRGQQAHQRQNQRGRKHCTYEECGRTGHTIDECWLLHPELRKDAQRRRAAAKAKRQRSTTSDEDESHEVKRRAPIDAQLTATGPSRPQQTARQTQSGAALTGAR